MTKEKKILKQDLASAHNWLVDFLRNNPGPHLYGGDAQLKNILYVLKKHTKDVPDSPAPNLHGHKDYEFIYQDPNK